MRLVIRNHDGRRQRGLIAASALLGGALLVLSGQGAPLTARAASTGGVKTWGYNLYHQLGYETTLPSPVPSQLPSPVPAALYAELYDDHMQPVPSAVSGLTGVKGVEGGSGHSLVLKTDGTVWAWGRNYEGELGQGSNTPGWEVTPVQVKTDATHFLTGVTAIAAGGYHNLAFDGTNVWAWGSNSNGQLGDGTTTERDFAQKVDASSGTPLTGVTAIAASNYHSLAIKSGNVWAWGLNAQGQLGDNTTTDRSFPVEVELTSTPTFLPNVTDIAAGYTHSLAVTSSGDVYGWGNAHNGQVGDGSGTFGPSPCFCFETAKPVQVMTGTPVTPMMSPLKTGTTTALAWPLHRISAGSTHSVVLKADGTVMAWGDDTHGQLGDVFRAPDPTGSSCTCIDTAVQVQNPSGALSTIQSVSAGGDHTVALGSTGGTGYASGAPGFAWGWDSHGELGDGTIGDPSCFCRQYAVPIHLEDPSATGLVGASALTAGGAHSLAVVG